MESGEFTVKYFSNALKVKEISLTRLLKELDVALSCREASDVVLVELRY